MSDPAQGARGPVDMRLRRVGATSRRRPAARGEPHPYGAHRIGIPEIVREITNR